MINAILERVTNGADLTPADMKALLEISDKDLQQKLFDAAYQVKLDQVGNKAYFRGIIECSNICVKDCYYCGIRKSNTNAERFLMDADEIYREAIWAYEAEYGSIVIQSGERQDAEYIDMIEGVLLRIKEKTKGELGITLSLGEQSKEVYQRWYDAGAHRYLLRIETSNPELYRQLHPADHCFEARKQCLASLKEVGYQVGTGVMMGLPNQTSEDLVNDLLFLKEIDIDMVGMGPYIPHKDTPMGKDIPAYDDAKNTEMLHLGLRMIAVTRLLLKDINIAATTALQALEYTGREQGLKAGANVIMPNVTETEYRPAYQLYDNKPCTDENSAMCRGCLARRVKSIGETIGFNEWGDSPHYFKRTGNSR
ncbi:[FeFe] hydrogenase H-cluster radical SAM maturase HydE [Verrucomicrobiota bacterium]